MNTRTTRKPRTADPALRLDLKPSPRGHWEGHLVGLHGAPKDCRVFLQADISFTEDVVEGEGKAPGFPRSGKGSASHFALAGRLVNGSISPAPPSPAGASSRKMSA
jgi:hypothetical protein